MKFENDQLTFSLNSLVAHISTSCSFVFTQTSIVLRTSSVWMERQKPHIRLQVAVRGAKNTKTTLNMISRQELINNIGQLKFALQ